MSFELGTDGPRVIVVGYDASDPAEHALAYATGLARRQGSSLVVVFAAPCVVSAIGATVDASLAGAMVGLGDEVRSKAASYVEGRDVPWRYVTGTGDAVRMLEQIAEQTRADAIVVGRSHHREHRWVGSVAVRLAKTCRRPVTVVP